jgi:hypothetical protein
MNSKNILATMLIAAVAMSFVPTASAAPPPGSDCSLIGYNPNAFVNICKTGPMPSPVGIGEPNAICIIGMFCPVIPTLDLDGNATGWEHGLYVEALCNQPTPMCGCSQVLQTPIYACTPIQG